MYSLRHFVRGAAYSNFDGNFPIKTILSGAAYTVTKGVQEKKIKLQFFTTKTIVEYKSEYHFRYQIV